LVDTPNEPSFLPLTRYGCKMATGSGKTVVMSMLIAWAFCNRGQDRSDDRFPRAALVCCPNLTVKERLQVLRPEEPGNYYAAFDLVPSRLRSLLGAGKVMVTNWHAFAPESEHHEGGKSYAVVNKGEENPDAFAKRVLGDLFDRAPLMVLNDEAHHAYRPAPVVTGGLTAEEKAEREEATVWVTGLDKINVACGIRCCVDLSATPFYLQGSGYTEGAPLPWLVSDFGLVDAIESGIVKIPRLPVASTGGGPEPKFYRLWENITKNLAAGERLPNKKPKPDVVWRKAQDALLTLASQWRERYEYIQEASDKQDKAPPVLILVCDNTDIARLFFERISGEEQKEDDNGKMQTVYGESALFPEFTNSEEFRPTLRIDSKMLAQAESEDPNTNRQDAAQQLRHVISTVGKPGQPGEHIRCVVSVSMLTEGWDANNVTHIFGLRAFGSQLLCEQVVGRGLRRMDYTPDPETGLLSEEYVDVYGIPFTLIPFKGRETGTKAVEDKPKNHVMPVEGRERYEIRFPVVEGYTYGLRRDRIKANITALSGFAIDPYETPTAVFVKPSVGYYDGPQSMSGPGETEVQNRTAFYETMHLQAIEFKLAQRVLNALLASSEKRMQSRSRQQLFPQVLRYVRQYVDQKVDFNGQDPRELGLETYQQRIVERLCTAIEPDDDSGLPAFVPILNRYQPYGSSADVNFTTTRPCQSTQFSQLNQVVLDSPVWEATAAFYLEKMASQGAIECYVRNDQMGFLIPYQYFGLSHFYEPDFIVRLPGGRMLILEVKGYEPDKAQAKHDAAEQWVRAVNGCEKMGCWHFHVCHNPQKLEAEIKHIAAQQW
jgi:type III restriction enzyme